MNLSRLILTGLALTIVVSSLAVAGPMSKEDVWTPDGKGTKLKLAEGEKIFVLPTRLYVPGDKDKLNKLFFAGFQGALGDSGYSGQPLQKALEKAGLYNLSWRLAKGIEHSAFFHNSTQWDACGGEDYTDIKTLLPKLMTFISKQTGSNMRYVTSVTIYQVSAGKLGRMAGATKIKAVGGIYDTKDEKIVIAVRKKDTLPKKDKAIEAKMTSLGKELLNLMVEK